MSWVNLNDVYVNQTGGTIAGDLSVNGALTVNDGKGTNTTYNVANEITTLRDSVSPTVIASTTSTSYQPFTVDLYKYRMLGIVVSTTDNRPLASTLFTPECFINNCTTAAKAALSVYPVEQNVYAAAAYYSNNVLYIKSTSEFDKTVLIAF